jgi:hypothetical protein
MRDSKNLERYCNRKKEGEILNKSYDFPIVALSLDISYGVVSKDYKNFMYGKNDIGFFNQFSDIRQGTLTRALRFYKENAGAPISDKLKSSIRRISREEYWKAKDFFASKLGSPKVLGDREELINYTIGMRNGLDVNHLKTLKSIEQSGLTKEDAFSSLDPKYQIAMTKKGHFSGENYGHAGNTKNSPRVSDPHDVPASIPNDYKDVLKEKRDELIDIELSETGMVVGLLGALTATYLNSKKLDYSYQKFNLSTKKIAETSFQLGFGIVTRETLREFTLNSDVVNKFVFEFREMLLKRSIERQSDISYLDHFADIDVLADAASLAGTGIIFKGYNKFKSYNQTGYINRHDICGDFIEVGAIAGGKYALAAYMDPTGASLVVVCLYIGGKSVFKFRVIRSKTKTNKEMTALRRNKIESILIDYRP